MEIRATLIFALLLNSALIQAQLVNLDFETPGGYTTNALECNNGSNYFTRTDESGIVATFINETGAFFAAQDINASPCNATLPKTLTISSINISGQTTIDFSVDLAEDDDNLNEDWDNDDYVHFEYRVDAGSWVNLLWVENDGSAFNSAPFIDNDFNGIGEGAEITDTFTTYTLAGLPVSGSSLDIRITIKLDAGEEDIAFDNIVVTGGNPAPVISIIPSSLTGFTYVEGSGPSAEQSFLVSGTDLSNNIILSFSGNTAYEWSETPGVGFTTSDITLIPTNGSISTTIYVRLAAGLLAVNSPFNIVGTASSTGASNQNITLNGTVSSSGGGCNGSYYLNDDFNDGDLQGWLNNGDWINDGDEMKHDLSNTSGQSYNYQDLGLVNLNAGDMEWTFTVRIGNWDPSSSNKFWVYLISNALNFASSPSIDGYAVGVNFSGTSDLLTLYSVTDGNPTPIITSTYDWDANDEVTVRVTRSSVGSWALFYDNGTGEQIAGSSTNNLYTSGNYCGHLFEFSSSRAGLFWLDDFVVCTQAVLPIELVDFFVTPDRGRSILQWETEAEFENNLFRIQRSSTGRNFEEIGIIKGSGTKETPSTYSFVDEDPVSGYNYYRLGIEDWGENIVFSPIEAVWVNSEKLYFSIYPLPAKDIITVNLNRTSTDPLDVYIHNHLGVPIIRKTFHSHPPEIELSISGLARGLYFLKMESNNGAVVKSFLKF